MKQSLRSLLLVLLVLVPLLTIVDKLLAQTVVQRPAVAFVTSTRDSILVRMPDGTMNVMFHNIPGLLTAKFLAVLGSNPAGTNFLIGGSFTYFDVGSSTFKTYSGLIAFPKDFNPQLGTTQIKFLKEEKIFSISPDANETGFRPLGGLTADGTEWFASLVSSSPGSLPLFFYHGRMDKNETDPGYSVDSVGPAGEKVLEGGYHLSNISITPDGKMVCSSVDRLNQDNKPRFTFYVWRIHDIPATMTVIDYTGRIQGLGQKVNPDSNFAFAVFGKSATRALIGVANLDTPPDNTIRFYETPIDGNNVSFTAVDRTLPRDAIPAGMNFFSGTRGTLPSGRQYTEVDPYAAQFGIGGDINFSVTGDTAVFVTHEAPDDISQRFKKSAIYMYDFTSGTTQLVYNDTTQLELQPSFVMMPYTIQQPEGTLGVSVNSLAFGTVDTGKTATKNAVLTNSASSGSKAITIDSIRIVGPNASSFTWTGATLPATVQVGDAGLTLNVTFTSSAPAGTKSAVARIFWNGSSTPNTITLGGTAHIPPIISVGLDEAKASISVSPNPFMSKVNIEVAAAESGRLEVKLFDVMGKEVGHSAVTVSRGEKQNVTFDAAALSLTRGVYYVAITLNDRTSVRQVVLK